MATRTRPAISCSRSQRISIEKKNGARITKGLAIRLPNVFIKEVVNLTTVLLLLLMIKTFIADSGKQKPSLLIVLPLAAMQSFAVNVKGKIVLMKVTTSRIPHHLGSSLLSWLIICCYRNTQMVFNFWWTQRCRITLLIQSWFVG